MGRYSLTAGGLISWSFQLFTRRISPSVISSQPGLPSWKFGRLISECLTYIRNRVVDRIVKCDQIHYVYICKKSNAQSTKICVNLSTRVK